LRRVLIGASTNSTNGYGVVRPLSAYRQAVRLLQNVVEQTAAQTGARAVSETASALTIYYSGDPSNPSGYPYARGLGPLYFDGETVADLVEAGASAGYYSFEDGSEFDKRILVSFTIDGGKYYAAPNNEAGNPFWVYKVNGEIAPAGTSYADFPISPGSAVTWQVIAPAGEDHGAQCPVSDGEHAMALR
ncbi:MAG: hypothetical protein AAF725_26845, partial [Acidobacteriota bacterium]